MSMSLGGITLPDLVWAEQFQSQRVAQSVRKTLGGAPIVFSGGLTKGFPITLSATEVNGTLVGPLRKSVVDDLQEIAAVVDGQYTLTINGVSQTVIFRHEDAPAVDMRPLVGKVQYTDNDLFRGDIKLLTV